MGYRKGMRWGLVIIFLLLPVWVLAENTPFRVGLILPLSGGLGDMGIAFQRGLDLYNDEHGGFSDRVAFQYEDHRYDGKTTVSAFHKLRNSGKADFIVVWGNTPSGSSAPVAEQLRVPLMVLSMNPDAKGKKHVISFGPKIEPLMDRVVEKFSEWGLKNPAAVSVDLGNALLGVEILKQKLSNKLFVKTIANEETDFKTLIFQLKQKKVDGLLLFVLPNQALTFLRQSSDLQFAPKVVGGDVFAENEFQKHTKGFLQEIHYVYGAVDESFVAKLREQKINTSYFYEIACGYTLASFFDQLGEKRKSNPDLNLIQSFQSLNKEESPILGLKIAEDNEYGLHFSNDSFVYRAKG